MMPFRGKCLIRSDIILFGKNILINMSDWLHQQSIPQTIQIPRCPPISCFFILSNRSSKILSSSLSISPKFPKQSISPHPQSPSNRLLILSSPTILAGNIFIVFQSMMFAIVSNSMGHLQIVDHLDYKWRLVWMCLQVVWLVIYGHCFFDELLKSDMLNLCWSLSWLLWLEVNLVTFLEDFMPNAYISIIIFFSKLLVLFKLVILEEIFYFLMLMSFCDFGRNF